MSTAKAPAAPSGRICGKKNNCTWNLRCLDEFLLSLFDVM